MDFVMILWLTVNVHWFIELFSWILDSSLSIGLDKRLLSWFLNWLFIGLESWLLTGFDDGLSHGIVSCNSLSIVCIQSLNILGHVLLTFLVGHWLWFNFVNISRRNEASSVIIASLRWIWLVICLSRFLLILFVVVMVLLML